MCHLGHGSLCRRLPCWYCSIRNHSWYNSTTRAITKKFKTAIAPKGEPNQKRQNSSYSIHGSVHPGISPCWKQYIAGNKYCEPPLPLDVLPVVGSTWGHG